MNHHLQILQFQIVLLKLVEALLKNVHHLQKLQTVLLKLVDLLLKKCISLTNIILNSVIEIDCSAFLECSSITNVIEINERNVLFGETIQNSLIENW